MINHEISERTNATAKLGIWKVDSSLGVLAKNIHFFRVFLENAMSEIKKDGSFYENLLFLNKAGRREKMTVDFK